MPRSRDGRPPRRMPSAWTIAQYWDADHGDKPALDFPENPALFIGLGEPYCFACGWLPPVPDAPTMAELMVVADYDPERLGEYRQELAEVERVLATRFAERGHRERHKQLQTTIRVAEGRMPEDWDCKASWDAAES